MKKVFSRIYLAFIFILLYAPIAVLIVLSFNSSRTRARWGGFTLKWYRLMLVSQDIMSALRNTLIIALLSALISTLLGLLAAIGLSRMNRKKKAAIMSVLNIPMLNAEIVTGISLMLIFIAFGQFLNHWGYTVAFGFGTVLIGHITFNLPYTVLSILPPLSKVNVSTFEAAMDLGCTRIQAFFRIVLPDILPGILSGFLLAFTLSLDDFVITHFVKGPGFDTLSTKIYTEVRKGIKPEMYALSTLLFVSVLILLLIFGRNKAEQKTKPGKNPV